MAKHAVWIVRGTTYKPVRAYDTKVPGQLFMPDEPLGSQTATLGIDAWEGWEGEATAKAGAWANLRAEQAAVVS